MRIYLLGFMGCGKTSLGKRLAQKLGFDFFDIDLGITEQTGLTVPEIFSQLGEKRFRELESQVLKSTANMENAVIATGGGTPCNPENMDFIKENGVSVYLRMSASSLAHRIVYSKKSRPLLDHLSGEELLAEIENRLSAREPYYMQADCIVRGESVKPKHIISLVFGEEGDDED